jgi:hypothetical protein
MRGIFEAIRDPRVSVIAIEAGAQTGKTIAAYIALAYWCAVQPGPVLIVMRMKNGVIGGVWYVTDPGRRIERGTK